jgi:hypothetical protein
MEHLEVWVKLYNVGADKDNFVNIPPHGESPSPSRSIVAIIVMKWGVLSFAA